MRALFVASAFANAVCSVMWLAWCVADITTGLYWESAIDAGACAVFASFAWDSAKQVKP